MAILLEDGNSDMALNPFGSDESSLTSVLSGDPHVSEANDTLAQVSSFSAAPLRTPPEIEEVAEVNEHTDTGEPILVPVVTCPLETDSEPPMNTVMQYVAEICHHLFRVYQDAHVRQFDVRFEFGPDRLVRSRTCRRLTIPPEMAAKLTDRNYDYRNLAHDVRDGDDGDSVVPPVFWGQCVSYHSGGSGGGGGAAAAGSF